MNTKDKIIKYLDAEGFTWSSEENGYTKRIVSGGTEIGIILIEVKNHELTKPMFRALGKFYFCMITLDEIASILDKHDRALTRIELGY